MSLNQRLANLEAVLNSAPPRCGECGETATYLVSTSDSDTVRCTTCGTARPSDPRHPLKVYLGIDPAAV